MSKDEIDVIDINPIPIKYSKYAHSLDKLFKNQSLETFKYNMKNPKKYHTREFEPNGSSFNKAENFDNLADQINLPQIKLVKRYTKRKNDNNKKLVKIREKREEADKEEKENNSFSKKKQIDKEDYPNPGKYNPNYSAIHKRVYGALSYDLKQYNPISRTTFLNLHNNYTKTVTNKGKVKLSPKKPLDDNNSSFDKSKNLENTMSNSPWNVNHAIKFSDYSTRKDTFKSTKVPILSYLNPENPLNSIKKTMIDFNKMKERNINDILNVNNYPAVCYYKPKIDFTKDHPQHTISFKKERNMSKKFLIKKMWGSYDVTTDYKFVKLQSFVDEKFDYRNSNNQKNVKK